MQEVKRPKRPLIFYYVVMILVILLFNCIVAPYIAGKAISDVEGVDEAEENLQEIVDYLESPEKYRKIGASILRCCGIRSFEPV